LDEADTLEMQALLARELALLRMWQLYNPQGWALWQASKSVGTGVPLGGFKLSTAMVSIAAQTKEACRLYAGLRAISRGAPLMPNEVRWPLRRLARALRRLPRFCRDIADVVVTYDHHGRRSALRSTRRKVAKHSRRAKLSSLFRVGHHYLELMGWRNYRSAIRSPLRFLRSWLWRIRAAQKLGPDRVEPLTRLAVHIRRSLMLRRHDSAGIRLRGRKQSLLSGGRMLIMALQRASEVAANRLAAEAVGSVEPVLSGIIRTQGDDEALRRLRRGELLGIVEDLRARYPPRQRWPVWWASAVEAQASPPLWLQAAELAEWGESHEGRFRLDRTKRGRGGLADLGRG